MKGVDTAAHKNYIDALIRKIKNPQELVEIGTGRGKKVVEVNEADEGVKYARAAIDYEEVRGTSAQQLLDAADGFDQRDECARDPRRSSAAVRFEYVAIDGD